MVVRFHPPGPQREDMKYVVELILKSRRARHGRPKDDMSKVYATRYVHPLDEELVACVGRQNLEAVGYYMFYRGRYIGLGLWPVLGYPVWAQRYRERGGHLKNPTVNWHTDLTQTSEVP